MSHRLANALVGNGRDAATLEVTLLGPELEFEDERLVAVAGAEFELSLDGRAVPLRAPFIVAAGSRLRFGARRAARAPTSPFAAASPCRRCSAAARRT